MLLTMLPLRRRRLPLLRLLVPLPLPPWLLMLRPPLLPLLSLLLLLLLLPVLHSQLRARPRPPHCPPPTCRYA